ncbi:nuclear transport factor 2 family protein [Novosphingobium terrae]|uniref:nuclear transport factor 2 family protein n=1 Tax=Novosphingobium terrae TaxID=2726189 RepID=UPI001F136CD7|nr:nuclear transport factor 2 family protein [Novosphingobium terrae]
MTDISVGSGESREPLLRRSLLKGGIAAMFGAMVTGRAAAAGEGKKPAAGPANAGTLLDQFAVTQVIARERLGRETHDFDLEESCFHPDAFVDVSWFSGTAKQFVEAGRRGAAAGRAGTSLKAVYFDSMSPPAVSINGDRAIADASCAVHSFSTLNGVDVHVTAYTRLLWRAVKQQGEWLIFGLRGIYIRDTLAAADPTQALVIDQQKLAQFRQSYRYLSYLTASGGGPTRNDRAGVDQPDTVIKLRAAERSWLAGETSAAAS